MSGNPTDLFARLVAHVRAGCPPPAPEACSIDPAVYTSEVRFRREWRRLFLARPLIAGHQSQLPQAGDALVQDWPGLPLVTVRGQDGRLRTFLNVCRHRNMRLVGPPGGCRLRAFVCPYHQWTYGLDGALRHVPLAEGFAGLEPDQLGLRELPTEVRHGFIWVLPRPEGRLALAEHLAGIGGDLAFFGLAEAQVYRQSSRQVACNWKLVQDAFLDAYHVVRLHRGSVGEFFPDAVALSDVVGCHLRSAVARKEIFAAAGADPAHWDLRRQATFSYSLFPNSVIVVHPDYISHLLLLPRGATQTQVVHTMLVAGPPRDAAGRAHFDRSFALIDETVIAGEDLFACAGSQVGMASGANEFLLLGAHEASIARFHEIVERELEGSG